MRSDTLFAVFVLERYFGSLHRPGFISITVQQLAPLLASGLAIGLEYVFNKIIHEIDVGRCVHPARMFVKALVDEELTPGHRTVGIEPFFADHVHFAAKEERSMRVDQQHGIA